MGSRDLRGLLCSSVALFYALFLLSGSAASAQSSSLKSRRDFAVGEHPINGVVADYDGDGLLDLVTVNRITNDLSLLKGFGDGTFRRAVQVPVGALPVDLAVADVNNDGRLDLIAANTLTQDVTVNLGTGIGGFGSPVSSPIGASPSGGLVTGDWNNDGKVDVATANTAESTVTILMGDGAGRFVTPRILSVGTYPYQIITADFNKDGRNDLAVVNNASNNVQVWTWDVATGQFLLRSTVNTGAGTQPVALTTGLFDGDTNLDIAVSNNGNDSVGIYLGDGTGRFPTVKTPIAQVSGPRGLRAADLNKDGRTDLLIPLFRSSGEGSVAVFNGDGTGGFPTAPSTVLGSGPYPNFAIVADFNRDSSLDVATINLSGNTVSIQKSVGAGAFVQANRINLPNGSFPAALAASDFNADTKADVVTANEFPNSVSFMAGAGDGTFAPPSSANNTGVTPLSLVALDFNRDGKLDVVTANNGDNTYSLLSNGGTGNFTSTNGLAVGCVGPVSVDTGDISGDLILDLAFVCEVPGFLCTRRGTGGSGSSAFGAPVCRVVHGTPEGIALGPYNLDVFADVGMALRDANAAGIGLSNGSGGLLDIPGEFPVGQAPAGIARGDLDGDGYLDLVLANTGSNSISALLGDGGGVFSFPSIDTPVGLSPTAVAIVGTTGAFDDVNLDGKKDVVAVNTDANNVTLLLGDGHGHFSDAGTFGTGNLPLAIATADFNRDGKPDLAVADNINNTVTVLLNQSVSGAPLSAVSAVTGGQQTVFRWGIVPGAVYDVIRGQVKSVTQGATTFNLGPVTCLADDLAETDTAAFPDGTNPPSGNAYFYLVRAVVDGIPGNYTVASPSGKVGTPSSGGCP